MAFKCNRLNFINLLLVYFLNVRITFDSHLMQAKDFKMLNNQIIFTIFLIYSLKNIFLELHLCLKNKIYM